MWKQKIGFSIGNHYSMPTADVIRLVHQAGFDAISPEWEPNVDLGELIDVARQCGLLVQSLHAPFGRSAEMWSAGDATAAKSELFAALDACVQFQIPVLVVHTWIGFEYQFDAEALHFQHFEELVRYAQDHGVQIAFENTEGEEYLFALMAHFAGNDAVGFCWDSGHELCYNHGQDLLEKYGDRLLMTHLNDNLGISRFDGKTFWTDDLHLLPYDGIADWENNIARLKKARRLEVLNFELNIRSKPNRHENDVYGEMPLERYFAEAYKRACRIASRYAG